MRSRLSPAVVVAEPVTCAFIDLDWGLRSRAEGAVVSVETPGMVTIPRADLDALKAELRRLRRQVGRDAAMRRIQCDPGPGDDSPTFTRDELAAAWGIDE